jgi:hypothetical protein
MSRSSWWKSRRTRTFAVVLSVLASWTCDREAAGPGPRAALAVEATLPPSLNLASFNLTIDNVRLIVVRPSADTVFDQLFSFPPGETSLPIEADVPLEQSPETFQVTIQLLSGTTLLFSGTQDVDLNAGQTPPPRQIPVSYSGPGQNVASLTVDPVDSALSFGGSLTFRPTARDGQGNLVTSFYVSWTTSDTVAAPIDATGTLVAPALRRTVTVTARTPTNVSASTPITFAPVATSLGIVSGCGQTGAPGAQLAQPIVVGVLAGDGLGVKGVPVSFSAPPGGSVTPTQAVTDAAGQAQTAATLGTTPGPASFTAGASGLTSVTCGQTVQSQATQLVFTAQPTGSVVAGTAFSIAVAAQDAQGGTATTFTGAVTLAIGNNPGGDSFGTPTVSAVGGVATFTGVSLTKAGTGYTLVAASGSLSGTSAPFDIIPAAPAQLAFSVGPSTTGAGVPIVPPPQVAVEDAFGNVVPTASNTVTMDIGTNPGGATLSGTLSRGATGGIATFDDLTLDRTGSGYTFVASSSPLTVATSAAFNVSAVPATQLVFTGQPTNVTAGAVIAPPVVVRAQDGLGNTNTSFTGAVTIAIGANPSGGTLTGTSTVNAVAGVATFDSLRIDRAGAGYTLSASASGLTGAASTPFTVAPGAATALAFAQQPGNSVAGATFAPAVTVEARDGQGNLVTSFTGSVTVALQANPGSAVLSGTLTRAATAGVATFNDLSLNRAATGYTLSTSAPGLTPATSAVFNISAGAAAQLAFTAQPTSALQGVAIAPPVAVAVQDALGNTVPGATNLITVSIGTNPNSGTLSGTLSHSAVGGVATFGDLSIDNPGNGYTVQAAATGLGTTTSATFNVLPNGAGVAWINAAGGNWSVAANWSPARVPVKGDSVFITLGGTYIVTLDVSDTVAFLSVGGASGTQTLTASGHTLGIDSAASLLPNGVLTLAGATVTGGGTLVSGGAIVVNPGGSVINATVAISAGGSLTLNGNNGFADVTTSGQLTNSGTITLTGSSWAGRLTAPSLANTPTGVVQVVAGVGSALTTTLNNQGAVQVDGPLTINGSSAAHQNSGTITLGAGSLTLTQSGTTPSFTTTGSVVVGAGRVLQVNGGAFNYANGSPGGLAGLGTMNLSGVTFGLNPSFIQDTLTLNLSNTTVNGPGTLEVATGRTLTLTQSTLNAPLNNLGTVLAAPGTNVLNGAVANQIGALLELNGNNGFADVTVADGFVNDGTIELTGTSWAGRLTVTNGALVNNTAGTLEAVGGVGNVLTAALDNQGAVQVDAPLTINKASAAHQNGGTITLGAGNLTLTQSGTTPTFTTSGDVVLGAGRTWSVSGGVLSYAGGKIEGNGTLALSGVTLGLGVSLTHDTLQVSLTNSTVNGPGSLTVASGATLTVTQSTFNAPFVNQGTVQAAPGTNIFNGSFANPSGALLELNGNNGFADVSVTTGLTNGGTIELTGTSWGGRLTVSGGALQNQVGGMLQVVAGTGNTLTGVLSNQGTVQVDGPLTINGASAAHQNGGTIMLGAGNLTLTQSGSTPSFTTTGNVVIGASRILQVNGGAFNYANASPGGLAGLGTVSLSGVTLGLNPDFTVDTLALTMTSSTVNGPGTLHVAATRTLTLTQSTLNAALDNAGTVLGTPGANTLNGAVTNQSGALLELNGNNGFADMTVASGFTNAGTIELTGTSWGGRLTVTSAALVNGPAATLQVVTGTGNTLTGALNNQGTVQVDGPLTINGASATHQNSGTITLGAGNLTLTQSGTTPSFTTTGTVVVGTGRTWAVSGGALNYTGGAIGGNGAMTLSGVTLGLSVTLSHDTLPVSLSVSLTNSTVNGPGTLPVAATSTLTMTGTTVNAPLVNFGTLQSTPGTNVLNGAVTNAPGALLELNGNNGFADMTVASGFTNAGTIELAGTSWAGRLTVGSPTTATLTNAVGATLLTTGGSGNVLAAALDNQGTVQVGGPLTLNAPSAGHGNSGLIKLAGGDLTVALSGTRPGISNTGTIDVGTNKMAVTGTGSFINQSTGTLMGSGTFDVSSPTLSFLTNGITTVGGAPGVGLLTFVGTYIMGPTGSINVEIGGTPNPGVTFDQLHADSVVFQSGGTLNAADLGGTTGNNYPVLTSAKAINGGLQVFNIPSNCTPVVSSTQYVLQCR